MEHRQHQAAAPKRRVIVSERRNFSTDLYIAQGLIEQLQALIARGVIPDYREPRIMRFGFTPLYTRFVDVWDAVAVLKDILTTRFWDQPGFHQRAAVT